LRSIPTLSSYDSGVALRHPSRQWVSHSQKKTYQCTRATALLWCRILFSVGKWEILHYNNAAHKHNMRPMHAGMVVSLECVFLQLHDTVWPIPFIYKSVLRTKPAGLHHRGSSALFIMACSVTVSCKMEPLFVESVESRKVYGGWSFHSAIMHHGDCPCFFHNFFFGLTAETPSPKGGSPLRSLHFFPVHRNKSNGATICSFAYFCPT
jgi:hypothetical protein